MTLEEKVIALYEARKARKEAKQKKYEYIWSFNETIPDEIPVGKKYRDIDCKIAQMDDDYNPEMFKPCFETCEKNGDGMCEFHKGFTPLRKDFNQKSIKAALALKAVLAAGKKLKEEQCQIK